MFSFIGKGQSIGSKVLEILRCSIFVGFLILEIRFLSVFIQHATSKESLFSISLLLVLGALTYWKSFQVLYGFVAAIPLLSGLQALGLLGSIPVLNLSFAALSISWIARRLFLSGEGISATTRIGNLVDILSAIVMLSLCLSLCRYPFDMVFYRFWSEFSASQTDPFYSIEAGYTLLNGLFFFRMMELEGKNSFSLDRVKIVIYIHTATIIFFSLVQLIYHHPQKFFPNIISVNAPFEDAHSYGSYIAFLLFVFFKMISRGPGRISLTKSLVLAVLFLFTVLSFSRGTYVAVFIIFAIVLVRRFSVGKMILLFGSLLAFFAGVNLFPDFFVQSNGSYIERLRHLLILGEFDRYSRIVMWNRAVNIIMDFPVTGSNIGSFYKISPSFQDLGIKEFRGIHENAHNYFLQFAAELGLPALIIFLLILLGAYQASKRTLCSQPGDEALLKGLVLGFSAYLITCLTGHPLLLTNQQFLFWFILSSLVISDDRDARQNCFGHGSMKSPIGVGILAFVIVVVTVYDYKNERILSKEQKYDVGFYEYEVSKGRRVRWMGRKAWLRTEVGGNYFRFEVYATPHNLGRDGLLFTLFLNGKQWDTIKFMKSERKRLRYEVPFKEGEFIEIHMAVNKTFNPKRLGLNSDNRNLGVLVSEIKFSDSGTEGPILRPQ